VCVENAGKRLLGNRRQGRIAQRPSAKTWQFPSRFSEALPIRLYLLKDEGEIEFYKPSAALLLFLLVPTIYRNF
jgi:hypothetical protein